MKNDRHTGKLCGPTRQDTGLAAVRVNHVRPFTPEEFPQLQEGDDVFNWTDLPYKRWYPQHANSGDLCCIADEQAFSSSQESALILICRQTLERHQHDFLCAAEFKLCDDVKNLLHAIPVDPWGPRSRKPTAPARGRGFFRSATTDRPGGHST